jgi:hypothetical protein
MVKNLDARKETEKMDIILLESERENIKNL